MISGAINSRAATTLATIVARSQTSGFDKTGADTEAGEVLFDAFSL